MTDKAKKRRREFAAAHNVSRRTAANMMRAESDRSRKARSPFEVDSEADHAPAYDESEYQRFKDMLKAARTPITELTALRDAVRAPFEDITRIANALRSPFEDIVRLGDAIAMQSPFREIMEMRSSLVESTQLSELGSSLTAVNQAVGYFGERLNNSPLGDAVRYINDLREMAATKYALPTAGALEEGLARLDRILPTAFSDTAFDRIMSQTHFTALENVGEAMAESKFNEPGPPSREIPRYDSKPTPPPEVIDLEIEPRCQCCGSALKGELALEQKAWSGPGKIRGELHVEVCDDCIRKAGGDPAALPRSGPKRPTD